MQLPPGPLDPGALLDAALACHDAGQLDQAEALCRAVLQQDPDEPDALNLLGLLLQRRRDLAGSIALLARAVALDPDFPEALANLARAQCAAGDAAAAAANASRAVGLDPELAEAHLQLGRALLLLGRAEPAAAACRDAVARAPDAADAHVALAVACGALGDHAAAADACRRALALAPQRVELWQQQAQTMTILGRFDEAAQCYDRLSAIAPGSIEPVVGRAAIGRLDAGDPDVARLQAALNDPARAAADRIAAGFALGAVFDRAGAYATAFSTVAAANDLAQRHAGPPDSASALRLLHRRVDWLIDAFHAETFRAAGGLGERSDLPVFVVGMPRSGTSLVEQIATRHPLILGAGKRKDIAGIAEALEAGPATRGPQNWDRPAAREAASAHLARLRALGGGARRVVDRLHDNVLLLGHIAVLFPQARVVLCRRDPRDVALSCFFQPFANGMAWSRDLAGCAARACEIERLVHHWLDVLPLRLHVVQYERLVADPEAESRRLIAFLGLEWNASCLTSDATGRAVMTASDCQVRQPVYSGSVGRWRHYRQHIGPLLEGLAGLVPPDATAEEQQTPAQRLRAADIHREAGRLAAAEAICRGILADHPDWPDALGLLAEMLRERNRPQGALRLLRPVVDRWPDHPVLLTALGQTHRALGDSTAAGAAADRAAALAPDRADSQLLRGLVLLDRDDPAGAVAALRHASALDPGSFEVLLHLAIGCIRMADYAAAAEALTRALRLRPAHVEVLSKLGFALSQLDRHEEALACHREAIALAPDDPRAHHGLVLALWRGHDPVAAIEAGRRILAADPGHTDIRVILGHSHAALGRFAEAAEDYRSALAIDPDCHDAQFGLTKLRTDAEHAADVARLEAVLHDPKKPDRERVSAGFALGMARDDSAEYDAAFAAFAAANRLHRGTRHAMPIPFDIAALRHIFSPETFAATAGWGSSADLPVFVVGLPRSGTSLVEQIAASHPSVFGAGERKDIHRIIGSLERGEAYRPPAAWDPALVRQEASRHLARLREAGGDASRVIDKMPDNVQFLGHIAVLFPRARVIVCRRDLRDVCLSCFFQNFTAGLEWTDDLADLAARARETERLIALWRDVLPLPMLEVQYEALVQDLEGESRRLIDFLGLAWDPACLAFHRTERVVMTASHWQVRQPIYTSSVGRWRLYRKHLGPLLDGLAGFVPDGD